MEQKNPQQAALDEALVPIVDQVKIDSFNMRIDPTKKQKEATYQVTLDILNSEILRISLRVPNQEFVEPPPHDALVSFLKQLGYKGMMYKKNVDYATLIWEDFQYQFDNRHSSANRGEHIPYPRFTKVIIYYFLLKHNFIPTRHGSFIHTIKYDAVLGKLKFVSNGEEEQKYGMLIPDLMMNDDIKNSVSI
ncbi:hypothetical protein Tco_0978451 [Tanacetum coccineum]|uniref:Uncharacterized protein n=1 Tax=Tanacetum coccineum TaxID=301880 RepID=A0ABQ5EMX8_9ASTR